MKRPLLKSQHQISHFEARVEGAVSLVSARAVMKGNRNWVVIVKMDGASLCSDAYGTAITPEVAIGNFCLERLDGDANLAFIIKHIEWIDAPAILQLHLFMDAHAAELDSQHLYEHVLTLVSFPNQQVNHAANRVPLFLLPGQPSASNDYGMKENTPTPIIDYMAKDFESIRTLMITNIQRMLPHWQDDTVADIGNMLVEVLAYVADYLSYRQDFTANEAYLLTAQLRTSITRHARLLGYFPDEGCAPRTILTFLVSEPLDIPEGFAVLSSSNAKEEKIVSKNSDLFARMVAGGSACYETRHNITALPSLNKLHIHDYGLPEYTLYAGSTSAIVEVPEHLIQDGQIPGTGSLIVFHQTTESSNTKAYDRRSTLRTHAVRLTRVEPLKRRSENAVGKALVRIRWSISDALPRDLAVTVAARKQGNVSETAAVVYANAVEAEYGLTRTLVVPRPEGIEAADWRPILTAKPLQSPPISPPTNHTAANEFLDPSTDLLTYPTILLEERPLGNGDTPGLHHKWRPTRDLLRHGHSSRVFMVDYNSDQTITLRFGIKGMGRTPSLGCQYIAHVREAAGNSGSVGAEVMTIAAPESHQFKEVASKLIQVNNLLPATAPRHAESNTAIRLKAPEWAHRANVCATLNDYVTFTKKMSGIRDAKAWNMMGEPWPYICIAVMAKHTNIVDDIFVQKITLNLEKHRPLGRRLVVTGPTPIPIEITLNIVAKPRQALLSLERKIIQFIGNTETINPEGYFSADRMMFDQIIFPNDMIAKIAAISGIHSIELLAFRRMDTNGPSIAPTLSFNNAEIPMLDYQTNSPAGGRLVVRFQERAIT